MVEAMSATLAHRGPDDQGVWVDEEVGVALAHRRLSILDLSPAGHQPMISRSGRYVMAFNGEIYNHLSLRQELERVAGPTVTPVVFPKGRQVISWRGHSDTESLLAGFEAWGIEATLKNTVGMFAIALWDREESVLTLARDRIGEKPLYYGFQNETFVFGSELKALNAHPDFFGEVDRDVLCLYLRHCYIPAPFSIYKGIKKLLPGTYLQLSPGKASGDFREITPTSYWSLAEAASKGMAQPFSGDDADAIVALETQLRQSIGMQMVADVPLGAFLSGGVDSSTVVALMQVQSSRPINTFSIGFREKDYNEAGYAKAVAQHLGTVHTELYVSSAEAMEVIPMLGRIYDEPFGDSSQIPTFILSKMTRQHVAVSLSGDGGDELFCGYNRYSLADKWGQIERIPFGVRKVAGRLLKSIESTTWDKVLQQVVHRVKMPVSMSEKLGKLGKQLVNVNGVDDLYYGLVSETDNPEQIVIGAREPATWLTDIGISLTSSDAKLRMMHMDVMTYLPDDILVKIDRAAMASSLETRVPFLDHRLVEMAWSLPMSMKMRDGESKWILRQVLYKYVPKRLIERPKAGFGIPLGDWLQGPLRDWVEALLDESRLNEEGYFDAQYVRSIWKAYLEGSRYHLPLLWNILMFQVWLKGVEREKWHGQIGF